MIRISKLLIWFLIHKFRAIFFHNVSHVLLYFPMNLIILPCKIIPFELLIFKTFIYLFIYLFIFIHRLEIFPRATGKILEIIKFITQLRLDYRVFFLKKKKKRKKERIIILFVLFNRFQCIYSITKRFWLIVQLLHLKKKNYCTFIQKKERKKIRLN